MQEMGHRRDTRLAWTGREMTEAERDLAQSVSWGFIHAHDTDRADFRPRLLTNDRAMQTNVLTSLESEFRRCVRFDAAVAFVTKDGVTVLMKTLLDLAKKNVHGRVLVSCYLSFTDPDALEHLLTFPNLELRAFEGPLHSKGYLFAQDTVSTLVVGSSNLTQSALLANREWNLMVHASADSGIWLNATSEFETLWDDDAATPVTKTWLQAYRARFELNRLQRSRLPSDQSIPDARIQRPRPNRMQVEALKNLTRLRADGQTRSLLVSATGTGKTYLAAFDVEQAHARRSLFVVHRERIARDALATFRNVMGEGHTYGLFIGSRRDRDADHLFCTFQSLAGHLGEFSPNAFDYLIVDEAHHAGAKSYLKILHHFKPAFTLGMTATAKRMDAFDICQTFNYNICYTLTLQQAESEGMLAPFHYFGIHDLKVEGQEVKDDSDFAYLTSDERARHLIREMERYTVDRVRRGLVFCSRVDESHELAKRFRQHGYHAIALDGTSTDAERERAIERLECDRKGRDDWLELIFCRDIFNEGVDIPSLNLIMMARPTESAVVFVQQLGRGLRKVEGKDYVLVLDFIGNYQKSYLIPVALSGDRSYNKDNLRRFLREGNRIIEGCSTIEFDEVSEDHIYRMLDEASFKSASLIKGEYLDLRNMLGRIPSLFDFIEHGSIDPDLIFQSNTLGSLHMLLKKYEKDYTVRFTKSQEDMLRFVSKKLSQGKRCQELLMLKMLIGQQRVSEPLFERAVRERSAALPVSFASTVAVLDGSFRLPASKDVGCFCETGPDGTLQITDAFARALQDPEFTRQVEEVIDFGLARFERNFSRTYLDTNLVLYQKYTYEDVCRLLDWPQNINGQNMGGYKYDRETNTFPVFINYEKDDDISDTIRYHDRFESPRRLVAISKNNRSMGSPEIVRLKEAAESGMRTFLFVRKNKDDKESKEFYFLGLMHPTGTFVPILMDVKDANTGGTRQVPAVEIVYDLDTPVSEELYDYLTESDR